MQGQNDHWTCHEWVCKLNGKLTSLCGSWSTSFIVVRLRNGQS